MNEHRVNYKALIQFKNKNVKPNDNACANLKKECLSPLIYKITDKYRVNKGFFKIRSIAFSQVHVNV